MSKTKQPKAAATINLAASTPVALRLPAYERVSLMLVGCGGTGSHIATGLAALALELTGRGTACTLTLVDPDRVERKNIGRQLFSAADLRRPKAAVLAERLQAAYRLTPLVLVERFKAAMIAPAAKTLTVIIGAVDNPAARAEIAAAVDAAKGRVWWLDAGNENHSGQVALGNAAKIEAPALGFVDALPHPAAVYPDLIAAPAKVKANARRGAVSCADATAAGEQGLMVNRMSAAWALALLNDLLLGAVRYFALDFNLQHGGTRARALAADELAAWVKPAPLSPLQRRA